MEDEQIEEQLYSAKLVEGLGFQSLEHYEQFEFHAIHGSINSQDLFIKALGEALNVSDLKQSIRLVWAFKEEFEFAAMAWKMHEARVRAGKEE
jgi:hypothetical protein